MFEHVLVMILLHQETDAGKRLDAFLDRRRKKHGCRDADATKSNRALQPSIERTHVGIGEAELPQCQAEQDRDLVADVVERTAVLFAMHQLSADGSLKAADGAMDGWHAQADVLGSVSETTELVHRRQGAD